MTVEKALAAERRRAAAQVADLAGDLQAIIDASADANADDEHDPEGSTIGFERAQVASLLDQARARMADLDQAEERLRAGIYGRCEGCGQPIGAERLAAHATATRCVTCAAAGDRPARLRPGASPTGRS
ncbi:MAG: DnaK suppressor protein [Actinomycetota bacterium]|jgi:RNA polymerase-binding transcription factor DksA|nr:DnaK suppressor protein [Actinomycetota bacterium]